MEAYPIPEIILDEFSLEMISHPIKMETQIISVIKAREIAQNNLISHVRLTASAKIFSDMLKVKIERNNTPVDLSFETSVLIGKHVGKKILSGGPYVEWLIITFH